MIYSICNGYRIDVGIFDCKTAKISKKNETFFLDIIYFLKLKSCKSLKHIRIKTELSSHFSYPHSSNSELSVFLRVDNHSESLTNAAFSLASGKLICYILSCQIKTVFQLTFPVLLNIRP